MEPRNYLANAAPTPPDAPAAPSNGFPQSATPGVSEATTPGPHWFFKIGEELRAAVVAAGLTPSDADLGQVAEAIKRMGGGHVTGISADTVLTLADAGLVLIDASLGNVTVTLPPAADMEACSFELVRVDASDTYSVTYQRAGTDTVGATTAGKLDYQLDFVTLSADGVADWKVTGRPSKNTTYTANGTFVVPPGVTKVWVSGCGGGGGGGGGGGRDADPTVYVGGANGGGGAVAAYAVRNLKNVTPGDSITVTIGAGGTAGAGGAAGVGGSNGGTGGTSAFGALVGLAGGSPGLAGGGSTVGGVGAGGAGGDAGGGDGGDGYAGSAGGSGGSSPWGTGGGGGRSSTSGGGYHGGPAYGYGAGGGGGGGIVSTSGTGGNGSPGMPGVIIVEW